MTTTQIQFPEKIEFETIRNVIENEFDNVKIHKSFSDLKHISFYYKGEKIYCYFLKDNKIYHSDGKITYCSSFSSDRPNKNKTEAFRIIAKHFDCVFYENDFSDDFEIFKKEKSELNISDVINCLSSLQRLDIDTEYNGEFIEINERIEDDGKYVRSSDLDKLIIELKSFINKK
jgi:hypothetical protein